MMSEWQIRSAIASLPVYQPGKPVDLVARELGLDPAGILKLASNENPRGASPAAREAVVAATRDLASYPDNSGHALRQAIALRLGVAAEQISLAAGSNEIFYQLCQIFVEPGKEVVTGDVAFISYRIACQLAGGRIVAVPMPQFSYDLEAMRAAVTDKTRLVFLANPNNPTGTGVAIPEVEAFARSLPPHVVFCYDEAYAEYADPTLNVPRLVEDGIRMVATRTFSKIHGLAGLRIGYAYGHPELIQLINQVRAPFNTSSVAQAAAVAALEDTEWVEKSRSANLAGLGQLKAGLDQLKIPWHGGGGNFLLVEDASAENTCFELMKRGLIVRPLGAYALTNFYRVTVGTSEQNDRFLASLGEIRKSLGGLGDLEP